MEEILNDLLRDRLRADVCVDDLTQRGVISKEQRFERVDVASTQAVEVAGVGRSHCGIKLCIDHGRVSRVPPFALRACQTMVSRSGGGARTVAFPLTLGDDMRATLALAATVVLLSSRSLQAQATLPPDDRTRIAEAFRLA